MMSVSFIVVINSNESLCENNPIDIFDVESGEPDTSISTDPKRFIAGWNGTYYVTPSDDLYVCGYNGYKSMGLGDDVDYVETFTKVASNVKSIAVSDRALFYITNSGDLYASGEGTGGNLGNGDASSLSIFTKVASNVSDIGCCSNVTAYLSTTGDLYVTGGWGYFTGTWKNGGGDDGYGTFYSFNKVASNVSKMSMSWVNLWYIDNSGDLYGIGSNDQGVQGSGTTSGYTTTFTKRASNVRDVYPGAYNTFYITNNGTLMGCGWGRNLSTGGQGTVTSFIQIATNVSKVAFSEHNAFYILNNGDLYGTGIQGSMGIGTSLTQYQFYYSKIASNVRDVLSADYSSWYITNQNDLFGCGMGNYGQQSNGSEYDTLTFTKRASNVDHVSIITYITAYTGNGGFYITGWDGMQGQGNGDGFINNLNFTKLLTLGYDVSFNANGGSGSITGPSSVSSITLPSCTFTAPTGKHFNGWAEGSANGTVYSAGTTRCISANTTYYAIWEINSYTVAFNSNGGSAVSSQTVTHGGTATAPSNPTKTDYKFLGWYDQALTNAFSFSTPITADRTIYAKWIDILRFTSVPTVALNIISASNGQYSFSAMFANAYALEWDMGDGTIYTGVTDITHKYSEPGTYTVSVTAYNDNGAYTEYSTITVPEISNNEGNNTTLIIGICVIAAIAALVVVRRLL